METASVGFIRNRFFIIGFLISALMAGAVAGLIWMKIKPSQDPIPLHYNVYFGLDYVGHWTQAFVIPGLAAFFLILNFSLAAALYRGDPKLSLLIVWLSCLIEIFLLIAGITLVLINIPY